MPNIRRISLFSGPGAGKSTLAAWLFARLKMARYEVEHVSEYVKAWAFLKRAPTSYDQVYITGKQLHKEDMALRSNPNTLIVTESPLFLTTCYARRYNAPCPRQLADIALEFEKTYPALNIFVDRADMPYNANARFQNEQQAREMDEFILACMRIDGLKYHTLRYDDLNGLEKLAMDAIGELPCTSL